MTRWRSFPYLTSVWKMTNDRISDHWNEQELTFFIALPGHTSWQRAGHTLIQDLPHKVRVEKHEGHDGHPAAELRHTQLPHHLWHVAVAPVDGWSHGPARPQQTHKGSELQKPQFAPQQVAARARHPALAAVQHAGAQLQRRRRPRKAAVGTRRFLGHLHGDEDAGDEDEDENGEEALGLASQVNGEQPVTPVQRWQQIAHAAPQADHEGEHGKRLAAVVLVPIQIWQKGLQRRKAHLATKVQQHHPKDQEAHLESGDINQNTVKNDRPASCSSKFSPKSKLWIPGLLVPPRQTKQPGRRHEE